MKKAILFLLAIILTATACATAAAEWICPNCGKTNTTKFCTSCGAKHDVWTCSNCGTENWDAYCGECGAARPDDNAGLCGAWSLSSFDTDYYLVFKKNGEWYINSSKGYFHKGLFTADAKQFTVWTEGTEKKVLDYSIQNGKMRIYEYGMEFMRSGEPKNFVLAMDGASMADTLGSGDLISFDFIVKDHAVERFDIAACFYPNRGDTTFIKRVIGLPGDTVELRDGYLYINGEKYEEPYIRDEYRSGTLNRFNAYTVPEGMYFVMGDHRNNSNDSRSVGPLDEEMIIGIATAINGKPIKQDD